MKFKKKDIVYFLDNSKINSSEVYGIIQYPNNTVKYFIQTKINKKDFQQVDKIKTVDLYDKVYDHSITNPFIYFTLICESRVFSSKEELINSL